MTIPPLRIPKLLTEREVAAVFGVSVDTIRRLRRAGKIAYACRRPDPLHRTALGGLSRTGDSTLARRQGERLGEIGGCWLSKRPNSPAWCRTWFDRPSRQTRRASLGTADLQQAKLKLAAWALGHGTLPECRPGSVALEAVLIRYYLQHACARRSGKQARYALRRWSDFFPAAVVAEIAPIRLRAFVEDMRREGLSNCSIRRTLAIGWASSPLFPTLI